MNKKLTWKQIKAEYPDQWVSIIEPEEILEQGVKAGYVIGHNPVKKILAKETKKKIDEGLKFNLHTFVYTDKIPYLHDEAGMLHGFMRRGLR
ncbi:MAG: hypothetical protein JXA66_08965 [Oligoflexia bacterium]|nr:hypothetical protein [Oligoflexia bacterium]